jgi:hypothetical protein
VQREKLSNLIRWVSSSCQKINLISIDIMKWLVFCIIFLFSSIRTYVFTWLNTHETRASIDCIIAIHDSFRKHLPFYLSPSNGLTTATRNAFSFFLPPTSSTVMSLFHHAQLISARSHSYHSFLHAYYGWMITNRDCSEK